jgi:Lon protease-like protein
MSFLILPTEIISALRALYTRLTFHAKSLIIRFNMYDLPLFPLNTVLFPGMPIQLHIFEPRYQTMLRRCIEEHKPFGVVLIARGLEAGGPAAQPHRVGTTARITDVEPLKDGRFNLTALGEDPFRILDLKDDLPYLVGKVECLMLDQPQTMATHRGARSLTPWLRRYLGLISQADSEIHMDLSELQLPEDSLMLLYWAAALLQIPAVEKQPLLEARTANDLLAGVMRLYRRETAVLRHILQSHPPEPAHSMWLN